MGNRQHKKINAGRISKVLVINIKKSFFYFITFFLNSVNLVKIIDYQRNKT